jgi:hypothetical protein
LTARAALPSIVASKPNEVRRRMAAKKTGTKGTGTTSATSEISAQEKAAISQELVAEVRKLLEPMQLEVIGHIEGSAMCCRNGTVALVKVDRASLPAKAKPPR